MIFPRGETFNFGSVLLTCCFNYDLTSLDFKPWFPPRNSSHFFFMTLLWTYERRWVAFAHRKAWKRLDVSLWRHDLLSHRIHGTGIFTYIWLICMVNVGLNKTYMDGMGIASQQFVYPAFLQNPGCISPHAPQATGVDLRVFELLMLIQYSRSPR